MTKAEKYTLYMETVAADQKHGYSQANRWGNPDYDCSSLVISALEACGIPAKTKGATYTGNMYPVLTSLGFRDVKKSCNLATGAGMQRGDILLNTVKHTAVYCGGGKIVHARGQSYGSSAPGDQGTEIAVSAYYNSPWDYVLRYNESGQNEPVRHSESYVGDCYTKLPMMVIGSYGEAVKSLQGLLNSKGYRDAAGNRLDVDGEYGDLTAQAVTALQKTYKFPSDTYWGTVAAKTWQVLLTGSK